MTEESEESGASLCPLRHPWPLVEDSTHGRPNCRVRRQSGGGSPCLATARWYRGSPGRQDTWVNPVLSSDKHRGGFMFQERRALRAKIAAITFSSVMLLGFSQAATAAENCDRACLTGLLNQ